MISHLPKMLQTFSILHVEDESKSWAMSIESACHRWLTCWEIWQWCWCLQLLLLILHKTWRRHWLSHLQNKVSHHYVCSTGKEYTGNKNPWWYLKYNKLDPQHLAIDFSEVTPTCTCFCFSALYYRFYRSLSALSLPTVCFSYIQRDHAPVPKNCHATLSHRSF